MSNRILKTATAIAVLGVALMARADDASYCKALVDKYRTVTGSTQNAQTVAVAMEQCAKDNASAAIPALEKSLQEQKATLPPRS